MRRLSAKNDNLKIKILFLIIFWSVVCVDFIKLKLVTIRQESK